ncbi:flavohemoglobin expression-modulating QEGLA motif protein [Aquiflexum sp. TKW24L]|uniref:flavohemoglobin expression-modulating QEGLA motif protein n=1 Tax=Aquiflexum sp. TKW24L TaxID=2942212 RepID=UPI0020BF09B6|nr:tyrosine/phenylalanine carboxypeptidase domain-containing protein [Aquiflexum sp. TKW24L]MCL6261010.1 flavohemoglobin expression-modulating QEGLA motif protein [Aquiflexum sp. TKW24L]
MTDKIDPTQIASICESFEKGEFISVDLPNGGKLVIDQKLPFICVYRFIDTPEFYLASLVRTQGAFLIVRADLDVKNLLKRLIEVAITDFKTFMILEIWNNDNPESSQHIEICYPGKKTTATVDALEKGFSEFKRHLPGLQIILKESAHRHPETFGPMIALDFLKKTGTLLLGIAFPTIFRDIENRLEFPIFYRQMSRKFAGVIKLAAYEFVRVQSDNKFEHYLSLGKTRLDSLTRSADKEISQISEKLDFILRVTPVNSTEEWKKFRDNKFTKPPNFTYRLISLDPEIEKRKLFNISLENVDHPTLAFLLRDKRLELEKQLIMLEERGTKKFLHTSRSVFGEVNEVVRNCAISLLNNGLANEQPENKTVNAVDFAQYADQELDKYRPFFPHLNLRVKIKDNVNGLIVSGPELSIGKNLTISASRMEALIQHEVGTHLLTYCNGHLQPLGLMYSGFAGYEQTQEGLAVLSEYLVGGLDINRLKVLAARVMAVDSLIQGADFIETFNLLLKEYGFKPKTAFMVSMRVHRGGGYTKDSIYLKGLIQVLDFIQKGGDLSLLFGGKFALEHLPLIEELTHVRILKKPMLPSYLDSEESKLRLERIKAGMSLDNLTT